MTYKPISIVLYNTNFHYYMHNFAECLCEKIKVPAVYENYQTSI